MTPEPPRRVWTEALSMWALTAAAISLAANLGFGDTTVSVVECLALIYVPVGFLVWRRRDLDRYGLHLDHAGRSLAIFFVVSAVTLIPFYGGQAALYTVVFHWQFDRALIPPHLARDAAAQLFGVALPEEVFYRGYLQTRLDDVFPRRRRVLGADVGASVVVTSLIFVAGHLVVHPQPYQLAIFFPSLVFGWLRVRSDGLLAPVLYHALCNLGMHVLQSSYR